MADKKITTGLTIADIEDAILQGQETYLKVWADVEAEYLQPLVDQMVAMNNPIQPGVTPGQLPPTGGTYARQ